MSPQQLKAANTDFGKAPSYPSDSVDLAVTAHGREPAAIPGLANDLLRGASEIAEFVFGDRRQRRAVYHLAVEVKCRLPVFRLGNVICARRSTLLRWVAKQEERVLVHPEGADCP